MSPRPWVRQRTGRRFPRVSGDEPWIGKAERIISAFSPRERG